MLFPSMPHESVGSRTAISSMYIRTCVNIRRCIVVLLSFVAPFFSVLGQIQQQPETQHTITLSGTPIDIEWSNDRKRILILMRQNNVRDSTPNHLYIVDVASGHILRTDTAFIYSIHSTRDHLGTYIRIKRDIYRYNDSTEFASDLLLRAFEYSQASREGEGSTGYLHTDIAPSVFQSHNNNYLLFADGVSFDVIDGRYSTTYYRRRIRSLDLRTGRIADTVAAPYWHSHDFVREAELSRTQNSTVLSGNNSIDNTKASWFLTEIKVDSLGTLSTHRFNTSLDRAIPWFDDVDSVLFSTHVVARPWKKSAYYIREHAKQLPFQSQSVILPTYRHRLGPRETDQGLRMAIMPILSDSSFVTFDTPSSISTFTLSPENNKLAVIGPAVGTDSLWTITTFDVDSSYVALRCSPNIKVQYSADTVYIGDELLSTDQTDYGTNIPISFQRRWFSGRTDATTSSRERVRSIGPLDIECMFTLPDTTLYHRKRVYGRFVPGTRFSVQTPYVADRTRLTESLFTLEPGNNSVTFNNQTNDVIRYTYVEGAGQVSVELLPRSTPIYFNDISPFAIGIGKFKSPFIDSTCLVVIQDGNEAARFCGYGVYEGEPCGLFNQVRTIRTSLSARFFQKGSRILAGWYQFENCKGDNGFSPSDGTTSWDRSTQKYCLFTRGDVPGENVSHTIAAPDRYVSDATLLDDGSLIFCSQSQVQRFDPWRMKSLWTTRTTRSLPGFAIGDKYLMTNRCVFDLATGDIVDSNMFGERSAITQTSKPGIAFLISRERDSNVVLYDVDERKLVRRIATYRGNADLVSVSRDGDAYAVLDSNGMLSVFDLDIKDLVTSPDEGDAAALVPTLRVRPNPATFDVTITIDSGEPTMVDIMSSEGRLVTTFPVTGSTTLPIDSLPVGYYRVVARMRNGLQSVPLVIVR